MTVSAPCPACGGADPLSGESPVCRCGTAWAKPKGGLTRTKGLAAGKGFGVRKPMAAGKGLSRTSGPSPSRAPMARQAPAVRPRKPRVAPEVREHVLLRAGGRCEVAAAPECRTRHRSLTSAVGGSQHHRLPGRMGGSKRTAVHAVSNLLQVCGHGTAGCHGWIESNRETALGNGWLLHEGQDPAVVPVLLHDGRRVLLGVDGYRAPADDTAHA